MSPPGQPKTSAAVVVPDSPATTVAISFQTIVEKEDAFRKITEMLGNPADLLHLEKTCRGTQAFFARNEAVWSSCKDDFKKFREDSRLSTTREKVLTAWVLRRCLDEQEKTGNVVVEELQRAESESASTFHGFATFLQQCLMYNPPLAEGSMPAEWTVDHIPVEWSFRNATAAVIAELVQSNVVNGIESAFEFADHRTNDNEYPILRNCDIDRGCKSLNNMWQVNNRKNAGRNRTKFPLFLPVNEQIIRRLAFKAGVTRLHPETFESIWKLVLQVTILILSKMGVQETEDEEAADIFEPSWKQATLAAQYLGLSTTTVYLDFGYQGNYFDREKATDDSGDSSNEASDDSESAWTWEEDYDSDVDDDCTLHYDSD
jgi:hypothetical protein